MDDAARTNMRAIHARGRAAGNNPNAFSKLGDSTFELPLFLGAFDGYTSTQYALGNYAWLTDTIRAFAGSWGRPSIAVVRGLSAPGMFDPSWVNPALGCESTLGPLTCELNVHRPAFLLMRLGANDDGNAARYAYFLRRAITTTLSANVVPVLSTRADRSNDPDDAKNTIVRQLASEFKLPVWDFDALAATLPERGLREDHVHLTYFFSNDFRDPAAYASGAAMHNLSALLVMDELLRALVP